VKLSNPGQPSARVAAMAYSRLNLPSSPVVGREYSNGCSVAAGVRTTICSTSPASTPAPSSCRTAPIGRWFA
jgi:hypothetical protein